MSMYLFNKDLASGWRVQAMEPLRFHVTDPASSGSYRHLLIPEGTLGTTTGDLVIYYAGASIEAARTLALDAKRLRMLLEHPERFAAVRNTMNYIGAVQKLKDDDRLAASIGPDVRWDSAPKEAVAGAKCWSYIPWLRLAASK
jgi:hypothetical protein